VSPPDNEVPSILAVRQVLRRDVGVAVSLLGAQVFSRGLHLTVVVQFRETPTVEQHLALREMRKPSADAQGLDVQVRYPDGRTAGLVSGYWSAEREATASDPDRLLLAVTSGGSGSAQQHVIPVWLSPLPGPGEVVLTVAWPALHVPATDVVVDGGRVAAAGQQAQMLWPAREQVTAPAVQAMEDRMARVTAEHPGVPPELTGVDWELVGLRQDGHERDVSAADAGLIIEPSGRFIGRTGNSFVGNLVVVQDRLRILRSEGHLALFPGLRGELGRVVGQLLLTQPRWSVDSARRQLQLRDDAGTTLRFQARDSLGVTPDPEHYLQQ
jgi:hypothetical protein